jgi:hypothetical protein
MAKRLDEDDLLLRAVRSLPPLAPAPPEDQRIAARARSCFLRHTRRPPRWARPLLPLSIAGVTVSYLLWAVHKATLYLLR